MPVFVIAYTLMYVFSLNLGWFPVQGYKPIAEGFIPFLRSIALPTLALGIIYTALIARIARASVLEVLTEDYIRTAKAKGLTNRGLLIRRRAQRCRAYRHYHRYRHCTADRRRCCDRKRL